MWTACAHSHTHSGEAEGECEIQIQGKGVDGTKHYIDRVRIVVTSTCTWYNNMWFGDAKLSAVQLPLVSPPHPPTDAKIDGPKMVFILSSISFVFHSNLHVIGIDKTLYIN